MTDKTRSKQKMIREFLDSHGESKMTDMVEALGVSDRRLREILRSMPDVEALGGNRNRTYRLLREHKE